MTKIIRIGIAEDHNILRQTMSKLLQGEPNLTVAVQAANGEELLYQLKENPVHVVILDLNMPIMAGKGTLKFLSQLPSDERPAVIILSMFYTADHIRKYIGLGANAFLSKNCEYPALVKAINDVYENGYHFNSLVTRQLISEVIRQTANQKAPIIDNRLSDREIDILRQICHQQTNGEIAEALGISQRTVENHRLRIMKKIGARTSIGLLVYAMKKGIADIESL